MSSRPIHALSVFALATASGLAWAPGAEFEGSTKLDTGRSWKGRIAIEGDQLTVTGHDEVVRPIDAGALVVLSQKAVKKPTTFDEVADGRLPAPWKGVAVGNLSKGGSAVVRGGKVVIETSPPRPGKEFAAFYSAQRPLPSGAVQFTARVTRLVNYERSSHAGLMLRDGNGEDARTVFLATARHSPAMLLGWDKAEAWNGSLSADVPVYLSPLVTAKTPGQAVRADVDVTGAEKLFLVAAGGPDGIVSDWANWIEPRIVVGRAERKLTELDWAWATTDFGVVGKGVSAGGGKLNIAGKVYDDGIGTHANSMIAYDLPPGTTRFRALCGIDRGGGVKLASVRFMVFTERPETELSKIRPPAPGLRIHRDPRGKAETDQWLRLKRVRGQITAYVSHDGVFWREIGSVKDNLGADVHAGLAAFGGKESVRWETTFGDVEIAQLEKGDAMPMVQPKITLIDGSVFHAPIDSATPTLLRLGGERKGLAIPLLTIARIEFDAVLKPELARHLEGDRGGVLLSGGDFFEGEVAEIKDRSLSIQSALFGLRSFDLDSKVDALVLRPVSPPAIVPASQPWLLETRRGGLLRGKSIRFEGGKLVIETVRLRTQTFDLAEIRRLTRSGS